MRFRWGHLFDGHVSLLPENSPYGKAIGVEGSASALPGIAKQCPPPFIRNRHERNGRTFLCDGGGDFMALLPLIV
jgi:hypothetical protein